MSIVIRPSFIKKRLITLFPSFKISGNGCSGNTYMLYGNNRMFSECVDHASHVVFELKKPQEIFPDKVNDTFEFQIETKLDYSCEYFYFCYIHVL